MICTRCGKWAGAHATLPGQSRDHLCLCPLPRETMPLTEADIRRIVREELAAAKGEKT